MKKSLLSSFLLIFCISFFAQSPEFINYQGVLRDANGNVLPNITIKPSSTIEIDAGGTTYTNPFPSVPPVVTNAYGLFSARISLNPNNANIDWNNTGVKIRSTIEYDVNGTAQSIQGSWEELSSVPYALYANEVKNYPKTGHDGEYLKWDASANNGNGGWVSSAVNTGNTLPLSATIGQVLTWNGVEWVAQDNDGYEANSDNQKIQGTQLNGTVLTIGIERGNSEDVNLATLQDGYEPNTDNQDLELSNNNLSLTNDNSPVDLSSYLDNTDNQNAAQVDYSNTNSGLSASTVQAALDEVNGKLATGSLTSGYAPKWNGSNLVNSSIFEEELSASLTYVGIGTNDPKENLHIASPLPIDNLLHLSVIASNTTAKRAAGISFSHDNDAAAGISGNIAAFIKAEQYAVNDNRTNLVFGTRSTNSSTATANDKVIIRYDGNVGIGVSDPIYKLDLGTSGLDVIRSGGLITDDITADDLIGLLLLNDDKSNGLIINDNGLVEVGSYSDIRWTNSVNDASTNTIFQVEGEMEVDGAINADDQTGIGFKDENGNLGIWVKDGGNVGINDLNPDYQLDVNGDARVGWNGNSNYIYVSPLQLKGTNSNSNWELKNSSGSTDYSYGGQIRFFDGSDAYFSFFIPVGYKMTGYDFYFGNYPNNIDVYTSGISGYGVTAIDSRVLTSSSFGTSSQSSLNLGPINSSSNYVIIKFSNNANQDFLFKGGRIAVERM